MCTGISPIQVTLYFGKVFAFIFPNSLDFVTILPPLFNVNNAMLNNIIKEAMFFVISFGQILW